MSSTYRTVLLFVFVLVATDVFAGRIEFRFALDPSGDNPFSREIWATIAKPSGETMRVPAVWLGDGRFGARILGDESGPYRLVVVEEVDGETVIEHPLRDVEPGRIFHFDVLNLPFIRVDPNDTYSFIGDDDRPYVPIGGNIPWAKSKEEVVEFYADLIPEFGRLGLNWARIWMVDWSGLNLDWLGEDEPVQPIPGQLDLQVAEHWDEIIELAEAHGVYVQMVFQHHGQYSTETNPRWHQNPWNAENPNGFLENPAEFFVSEKARSLTKQKQIRIEPKMPPDLLGVLVLLPVPKRVA